MTTDPHAFWRWFAIAVATVLLSLGGGAIGKTLSDSGRAEDKKEIMKAITALDERMDGLDKRLEVAVNNLAGPVGISVKLTEISNQLLDLKGMGRRLTLLEAGGERYSLEDHREYAAAHDRLHAADKELFQSHASMVAHRLGDLEARVRERGPR
jgi:hypothetical protein